MNPALIIAAIAAVASMYANNKANQRIQQKQSHAMDLFNRNIEEYRQKGEKAALDSAQGYLDVPNQGAQAATEIMNRLKMATRMPVETATSTNPIADSPSGRVAGEQQRRSTQEFGFTDRLGESLSKLMGYDRSMAEAELRSRQNAMDLRNLGIQANMDKGVLDTKLAVSPAYGANYQMLGDIMSMVSQAAMASGLKGPRLNSPEEAARIPVRDSVPTFTR